MQLKRGRVGASPRNVPQRGKSEGDGGQREKGWSSHAKKQQISIAKDPDPKPRAQTATATFGRIGCSWGTIAPTPHLMLLSPPGPTKLPALGLVCSPSSSSSPCSEGGCSHESAWPVSPSLRFDVYAMESTLLAAVCL